MQLVSNQTESIPKTVPQRDCTSTCCKTPMRIRHRHNLLDEDWPGWSLADNSYCWAEEDVALKKGNPASYTPVTSSGNFFNANYLVLCF